MNLRNIMGRLQVLILVLILISFAESSQADVSLDISGITFQDTLTTTNNPKANRLYYDLGVGLSFYQRSSFYFGMSYIGFTSTDVDSTAVNTTWSATDLGAFLKYYIGKRRLYSITVNYGIQVNATYTLGTNTAEKWSGSSTAVKLSYLPEINENLSFGLSLLYYMGNYTTSRVTSTITDISKKRTYMLPLLGITYTF